MRFPDETGKRLTEIGEQSSMVQSAWNAQEFVGLAVEVRDLRKKCDDFIAWAEESIERSGEPDNDKSS